MSAYIVSDTHISALVTWAASLQVSFYFANQRTNITWQNAEEIGRALLDENVRSVGHRYEGRIDSEEKNAAASYKFVRFDTPLEIAEVIKACHCLDYQSCETDDWKDSKAYAILQAIEDKAITRIPGYERAPWGIDSEKGLKNAGTKQIPLTSLIRRA
jgi:hypothetical protein